VTDSSDISLRRQLSALYSVGKYRPPVTVGLIVLSIVTALLEGVGLTFLIPVLEITQGNAASGNMSRVGEAFLSLYEFFGVPFTLEFVILGVAVIITVRYSASFAVAYLKALFETDYVRHLQTVGFRQALDARVSYYDEHGSDEVLNAIVTQAEHTGRVIRGVVKLMKEGALTCIYLGIALFITPALTLLTAVFLGGIVLGMRYLVESGYDIGDRVAEANERIQENVQAGTQGIRDVKLFGVSDELFERFRGAADQFLEASVKSRRNSAAMNNFYQLVTAITVFFLIYLSLRVLSLSFSELAVFLFAMFRLSPRVSSLNHVTYRVASNLPHLVRTREFNAQLRASREPDDGERPVPETVDDLELRDVSFTYDTGEEIFDGLSLAVERGEFVAFVGQSGAGKSTIVSLVTRLYDPDDGEIRADGVPIDQFPVADWRSHLAVVRQNPYMFNETLRRNVTLGNRDASQAEVERVCEIARVTEFIDDLPNGYDSVLGDDGVRLSGGQKQRVALARALLKDADFLVLDEATSDLDSGIEEEVHTAIEEMSRDYAILVIAHRLSTVTNADRIYTIENGSIEEVGSHGELVDGNGTYADLYATQTQSK
jgi:subfamily B ATP-binding cassette protein MsbA